MWKYDWRWRVVILAILAGIDFCQDPWIDIPVICLIQGSSRDGLQILHSGELPLKSTTEDGREDGLPYTGVCAIDLQGAKSRPQSCAGHSLHVGSDVDSSSLSREQRLMEQQFTIETDQTSCYTSCSSPDKAAAWTHAHAHVISPTRK